MRSSDRRGNGALVAFALAACTAFAAPEHEHAAASAEREWTWSGLAPAMASGIDAALGAGEPAPPGDLSPGVREAIDEAVVATLPRVFVKFGRLTSQPLDASPGEALLAHERSARLFRQALAASLSAREIACPDCAPPLGAVRDVSFLDLLPYAIASTYVGTDDMEVPAEKGAAHVCAGGIIAAMLPDDELAEVALAAMLSGMESDDSRLFDAVRKHVRDARRDRPKGDARVVTDLYRIRLLADRMFIDALRGPLSAECKAAGLRCADCPVTPCP